MMTAVGGRSREGRRRSALAAVLLALGAAAVGYLLHHLPPLGGHGAELVALAVAGAAALVLLPAVIATGRRHRSPPVVLVAAPGSVAIRSGREDQRDFCAALHAESLAHGFFVHLGPRFLRAYYTSYLRSPHAIVLIATVDDYAVGALVGILRPREHARWVMRRRGGRLAVLGVVALAVRPRLAARFVRTRLRRYTAALRRHRAADVPSDGPSSMPAVLSHVAVLPGARRSGAGAALVREFERRAHEAEVSWATLTTLTGDDGAGDFYARLGWRPAARRPTPDGGEMIEWAVDLETRADR